MQINSLAAVSIDFFTALPSLSLLFIAAGSFSRCGNPGTKRTGDF
jgi:hypothetical protein